MPYTYKLAKILESETIIRQDPIGRLEGNGEGIR